MKIELTKVEEQPAQETKYPCLMRLIGSDVDVLFIRPREGIVVNCASVSWKAGDYCTYWAEGAFRPLPPGSTVTFTQE
jgi:hypothetical protein